MRGLRDKNVLITGAAQGIGLACAQRFLEEGARVALFDIKSHELEQAHASLNAPMRTQFEVVDVANKTEVDAAVGRVLAAFGSIDVLINNAGITHAAGFLELQEADFDRVLATNLKGYFLVGQAVARSMVERSIAGCIVNMSSVNALIAIPEQVAYVTSKGGVNQLTSVMAMSLAAHGIRVNGIGPGTILTELAKQAVLSSEGARRKILSRTPMGRCGTPDEIAAVAAFLASDDASYFTGQTLYPDGGRLALNYTVPVQE